MAPPILSPPSSASSILSTILQNKFLLSLAVATIVSLYAWSTLRVENVANTTDAPPPPPHSRVHAGGVASRLFFVAFLATYLLSVLIERFSLEEKAASTTPLLHRGGEGGDASATSATSLRTALRHVDLRSADF